jgi:hypothetical protein
MASRFQSLRPGALVLALAISVFIWAVAQGTSSVQQSFEVEVELVGVEDTLVVTEQSADSINVRLRGSRAALRNFSVEQLKYRVDARGGKPGVAVYEVDVESIPHPTGTSFVGLCPVAARGPIRETGPQDRPRAGRNGGQPGTGIPPGGGSSSRPTRSGSRGPAARSSG